MKHVVKDIGEIANNSSGEKDKKKELRKLSLWAIGVLIFLYFSVSFLAEFFITRLSIENEKKWFGHFKLIESDESSENKKFEFAQSILKRLIANPSVPDLDFKLYLMDSKGSNAFAFPGGGICVTQGLLDSLDDEISLAFVLGHEIGHFKHRHHLKRFARILSVSLVTGLIFNNQSVFDFSSRMVDILERKHSRDEERDSDFFGAKLVYDVYGQTDGIDGFFRAIKDEGGDFELSFLSTHPATEDRIIQLKKYTQILKGKK